MTEDIGLQSMDCVTAGDWLVITRGPGVVRKDASGVRTTYSPEFEGALINVLAVSPPIMLVRFFPFPTNHVMSNTVETAWHWDRQRFARATDGYVETYLQLAGFNRDGTPTASRPRREKIVVKKPKRTRKVIVDGKIETKEEGDE